MTDRIIDGRLISRQVLLQLLRGVCSSAAALCGRDLIGSGQWEDRANETVKECTALQRGLNVSHPKLADELHILATEIRIALAAQPHDALFAARIEKIRAAIHRVQQSDGQPDSPADGVTPGA